MVSRRLELTNRFDYSRERRHVSLRNTARIVLLHATTPLQAAEKLLRAVRPGRLIPGSKPAGATRALAPEGCPSQRSLESRPFSAACLAVMAALLATLPAAAQYAGKVSSGDKEAPVLRSIAVLEWTGDEGKPKASRLVPVAVLDGDQLQDGGIYLARPWPLAVIPEVEYELQQDGKPVGLFDIKNAGQQMGSWVGFGSWKPMPSAHPKLTAKELAKTRFDDDDAQSDEPVLHRKHHADDANGLPELGNAELGQRNRCRRPGPGTERPRPPRAAQEGIPAVTPLTAGNGPGTSTAGSSAFRRQRVRSRQFAIRRS